ncbi:MAG: hypothetical protein ACI38O_08165 [Fibrobacter intestinalis]|uniref:hypothetical protein n=1 Tax=Fibrobacter intestinalis TaxID=28122 RepID=UPI003F12124D
MATVSVASAENFFYNAILALILIAFFCLKLLQKPVLEKKMLLLFFLSLFPLIVSLRMNLISLFLILTLIFLRKELFNAKGRRLYLLFSIIFLSLIFIAYFLGFNNELSSDIWNPRKETFVYRAALGFTHPNQAMLKCFGIVIVWLIGVSSKKVIKYTFFSVLFVSILYLFTFSRTVFFVVLTSSLLLFFFRGKFDVQVPSILEKIISFYPLIFLLLSLLAMKFSGNETLNLLFSGRLGFYKAAVDSYGITLFGSSSIEKGGAIIDSSYFNTLLSKGLLFFLCYILIFKYATNKTIITYKKAILLTAYFLCAFTETLFFKFDLAFALFLILFYENSSNGEI